MNFYHYNIFGEAGTTFINGRYATTRFVLLPGQPIHYYKRPGRFYISVRPLSVCVPLFKHPGYSLAIPSPPYLIWSCYGIFMGSESRNFPIKNPVKWPYKIRGLSFTGGGGGLICLLHRSWLFSRTHVPRASFSYDKEKHRHSHFPFHFR